MDELESKKLELAKTSDPLRTRKLIVKVIGSAFSFLAVWQVSLIMGCKVWLGGALVAAVLPFLYFDGAQETKASKARVLVSTLVVVVLGIGLISLATAK